jgi:hypothetical protein
MDSHVPSSDVTVSSLTGTGGLEFGLPAGDFDFDMEDAAAAAACGGWYSFLFGLFAFDLFPRAVMHSLADAVSWSR